MSAASQLILSALSGVAIGAMSFSLWLAGLIFIYLSIYNLVGSGGFLFDSLSFKTSVFMAFALGLVFGAVHGFFFSIVLKIFGASSLPKSILFSLIVTEILTAILFLFISFDTNPISMIAEAFVGRFYDIVKISLVLLVPSILVGVIATKIISIIPSK
jgi:hypothetical protein